MRSSYRKPIPNSTSERTELVGAVAAVARDTEARLLSAGLHDVRGFCDACADAGLLPESFAYAEHRMLFKALVVTADLGYVEWTLELFLAWNHIPTGDIKDQYPFGNNKVEVIEFYNLEIIPTGIPRYAKMVAELHRRRTAAQEHYRIGDDLLHSVFPIYELIADEVCKVTKSKSVTVARRTGRKVVQYV